MRYLIILSLILIPYFSKSQDFKFSVQTNYVINYFYKSIDGKGDIYCIDKATLSDGDYYIKNIIYINQHGEYNYVISALDIINLVEAYTKRKMIKCN